MHSHHWQKVPVKVGPPRICWEIIRFRGMVMQELTCLPLRTGAAILRSQLRIVPGSPKVHTLSKLSTAQGDSEP